MTALASREMPVTHTSAAGAMYRPGIAAMFVVGFLSGSATASTYEVPRTVERTAAGPAGQIAPLATETTAEAVLEIRRCSGLTWDEMSSLFDVSRRSMHHWASGKAVSAAHEQAIRRTLAAIRNLDRGRQAENRAQLLAIDAVSGLSVLDLLKANRFAEAIVQATGDRQSKPHRVPLAQKALDARRTQTPMLLLEAEQDRPEHGATARLARARRTSVTNG